MSLFDRTFLDGRRFIASSPKRDASSPSAAYERVYWREPHLGHVR